MKNKCAFLNVHPVSLFSKCRCQRWTNCIRAAVLNIFIEMNIPLSDRKKNWVWMIKNNSLHVGCSYQFCSLGVAILTFYCSICDFFEFVWLLNGGWHGHRRSGEGQVGWLLSSKRVSQSACCATLREWWPINQSESICLCILCTANLK